ncbi:unnamed protein product [Adineta ricciae]|nr:unnamed protein product [Adineta ricciae]
MFISTKTTITSPISDFVDKFTTEIEDLEKHIDRVRQQFRAAKKAREVALEEENVATIQLDWSENYNLKQARQEKASYYYEQHISILSGYVWMKDGCYSFGSVSDDTNHMFEAAWTGLQPIFDKLKNNPSRITTIIFISDSPVSQFRNKTTFFFLKQYAVTNQTTMKWIYLEAGHGKGVADASGATIKRLMDQTVAFHPDESYRNAADLINEVKKKTNIKLFTYSREEIDSLKKNIPSLTAIKGTASLHEVTVKPDGALYGKDTSFGTERLLKLNF